MAVAAAVLFVVLAPPAEAVPLLEQADAEDLATTLAEATETQDVCYGWEVEVNDESGLSSFDAGSSSGVGSADPARACGRWVVFTAFLSYTSDFSEAEDSAVFAVDENITDGPTSGDLRQLGISEDGLLGDNDDIELVNAVSALPALVADAGLAEPITLEPNADALPDGDGATGTPGSDWLRQNLAPLAVLVGVLVLALAWAAYLVVARSALRSRPPTDRPRPDRLRNDDEVPEWTP